MFLSQHKCIIQTDLLKYLSWF